MKFQQIWRMDILPWIEKLMQSRNEVCAIDSIDCFTVFLVRASSITNHSNGQSHNKAVRSEPCLMVQRIWTTLWVWPLYWKLESTQMICNLSWPYSLKRLWLIQVLHVGISFISDILLFYKATKCIILSMRSMLCWYNKNWLVDGSESCRSSKGFRYVVWDWDVNRRSRRLTVTDETERWWKKNQCRMLINSICSSMHLWQICFCTWRTTFLLILNQSNGVDWKAYRLQRNSSHADPMASPTIYTPPRPLLLPPLDCDQLHLSPLLLFCSTSHLRSWLILLIMAREDADGWMARS